MSRLSNYFVSLDCHLCLKFQLCFHLKGPFKKAWQLRTLLETSLYYIDGVWSYFGFNTESQKHLVDIYIYV